MKIPKKTTAFASNATGAAGRRPDGGFTIVELMIALSVLATILIMATVILIQIGALYSKGVNASDLQNAARNVQDDITSAIRFGGSAPTYPTAPDYPSGYAVEGSLDVYAICMGTTRYSYVINRELGTDMGTKPAATTTYHVLWRDTMDLSDGTCPPIKGFDSSATPTDSYDPSGNGYEMAPLHTRLIAFSTTEENPPGSDVYDIVIEMAYGDSDLLNLSSNPPTCKGGTGQQFCAVARLSTTAARRLD